MLHYSHDWDLFVAAFMCDHSFVTTCLYIMSALCFYLFWICFVHIVWQDYLEYRGYLYERLDGSVRAEERFASVRKFDASYKLAEGTGEGITGSAKPFVFLLTTRAGGVGLNLTAADTVRSLFFKSMLTLLSVLAELSCLCYYCSMSNELFFSSS